ncbi:hypothetical protein B0H10DRAFT_17421 [Mycena sp. CBHHK59/15]|nr:hypothetical protein B0H10DRAFT_17421 [Mycena sp. CBHHK59/15]
MSCETRSSASSMSTQTRSSVSSHHEPQRRLLPCQNRAHDPNVIHIRVFPCTGAPTDDDDDAVSWNSHISGVEAPEEYAKASIARGDYAADAKWLKRMSKWVQGTSASDDEQQLVNDAQIEADTREQPRPASSLDLSKPDYLNRKYKRLENRREISIALALMPHSPFCRTASATASNCAASDDARSALMSIVRRWSFNDFGVTGGDFRWKEIPATSTIGS